MTGECAFCGKGRTEVKKLFAGAKAMICDECVVLCVEISMDFKPEFGPSGEPVDTPFLARCILPKETER